MTLSWWLALSCSVLGVIACTSSNATKPRDSGAADSGVVTGPFGTGGHTTFGPAGRSGGAGLSAASGSSSAAGMSAPAAGAGTSGASSVGGAGQAAGSAAVGGGGSQAMSGLPQACAEPVGSCPARSIAIWQVLLDAMAFGPEARLVATGGRGVLIAVGADEFRVARLRGPREDASPAYASWELAAGDLRPIAIVEGRLSSTAPTIDVLAVLACDMARTRCSLLRSEVTASGPGTWQEIAMPSGFVPRGVALDTKVMPPAICVYGNGMFCLKGDWQPVVNLAAGLQLNDVAFGMPWSVAVGEGGRWFKREAGAGGALGAWQEQPPLSAALTQVSVGGDGSVITGERRVQAILSAQKVTIGCAPPGELAAFLLSPTSGGVAYSVASDGAILQHAPVTQQRREPYCAFQQLSLSSAVLDTGTEPCDAAINPRLLTERALFGTNFCLSI